MENSGEKTTDKKPDPQPDPPPQPPPYSELPPPNSIPYPTPAIAVYNTQSHHLGNYTPDTVSRTHVVTQQPGATVHVITRTNPFGETPRMIVCPRCHQTGNSMIIHQPSLRTHLLAMSLCIVGFWPCVPMVYCMDCCTNVNHYCSNCSAYQGTYVPVL